MNVRKITGMAMMTAFSIVLLCIPFLRFSPFPGFAFFEYDAADIPIIFCTFLYGPSAGLIVTVLVSLLQGFAMSSSGIIGVFMHIFATGTFVLSGGVLFKYLRKTKLHRLVSLAISTAVGIIAWVLAMVAYNMIFTPLFMEGADFSSVMAIMLPVIIPFNLMKAGINGAAACVLYMILYPLIVRFIDNKPITTLSTTDIAATNTSDSMESEKECDRVLADFHTDLNK